MNKLLIIFLGYMCYTFPAFAEDFKQFKDWLVACDNLRTCTAIGVLPEEKQTEPWFLKITREGLPDSPIHISISIYSSENLVVKPNTKLKLIFDTPDSPIIETEEFSSKDTGSSTANLPLSENQNFITSLHKAKLTYIASTLPIKGSVIKNVVDKKSNDQIFIPLSGAVAALMFIDEQQKRVGTATAFMARGSKPNSIIPSLPVMPVVEAKPMHVGNTEKLSLPKEVKVAFEKVRSEYFKNDIEEIKESEKACTGDLIRILFSKDVTLWGICLDSGAYNIIYSFFLEENGKVRPAVFKIPHGARRDLMDMGKGILINSDVSKNGLVLNSYYKGVGHGGCGESGDWVWDGKQFQLLQFKIMPQCSGILDDDWLLLYRAKSH